MTNHGDPLLAAIDQPCHADVLLDLANAPASTEGTAR